jgi:hypothetical protein
MNVNHIFIAQIPLSEANGNETDFSPSASLRVEMTGNIIAVGFNRRTKGNISSLIFPHIQTCIS